MKKYVLATLFAVMSLSSISKAATGEDSWQYLFSTMITSIPTIASMGSTDAARGDRKLFVERVANDALLNIETGEQTELLKAVLENVRTAHPELKEANNKEISKRLVQEAIHFNVEKAK